MRVRSVLPTILLGVAAWMSITCGSSVQTTTASAGPGGASAANGTPAASASACVGGSSTGSEITTTTTGSGGASPCAEGATKPCYTGPALTENIGQCKDGISTCMGGVFMDCVGEV